MNEKESKEIKEMKEKKQNNDGELKHHSKIPNLEDVKEMSKDEIIETLRNELRKKDKEIELLNEQKEILFKLSLKNTKKRLESNQVEREDE